MIFINSKMQYVYQKTQNFMNQLKKLQKSHAKELSAKKWQKIEFFTFITVGKSFRPVTSLWWTFLHSFQRIRTRHRMLRFMTPISRRAKSMRIHADPDPRHCFKKRRKKLLKFFSPAKSFLGPRRAQISYLHHFQIYRIPPALKYEDCCENKLTVRQILLP